MINKPVIFGKIAGKMFEIKSYSRKEFALLYFPTSSSAEAANKNLRRWLNEYKESEPELLEQIRGRHILRRCDVEKIVALLGEP